MIGKIVEYDKNTQIGYILGFDDLTYEIPTAVRIEKKE